MKPWALGAGALIGAINIITRDDFIGHEISYRVGEGGLGQFEATHGFKLGQTRFLLNYSFLDSEGVDISQPANLDHSLNRAGSVNIGRYSRNWAVNLTVRTGATFITARAEQSRRTPPRLPGSTPGFFVYDNEVLKPVWEDKRAFVDLKHTYTLNAKSRFTLNPSYHHSEMHNTSFLLATAEASPPYGNLVGERVKEDRFQLKLTYDYDYGENLHLLVGTDHLYTRFSDARNLRSGLDGEPGLVSGSAGSFFPDASWTLSGYYVQGIWKIKEDVELTFGTRYDRFAGISKPRFTSRAAVVYSPTGRLTTKFLYAESYLSPSGSIRMPLILQVLEETRTFPRNPMLALIG